MTCLALSVPIVSLSLIFIFIFLFYFLFFLQANNDVYNLGSIYAHRGRQRRNKTQMMREMHHLGLGCGFFFFLSLFFNTNKYFILGLGPIEGTGG